jgi:site-specific recombinase XerD
VGRRASSPSGRHPLGRCGTDTVAEAEEFITDMKSDTFRQKGGYAYKPSTIRGYERDLNNHVIPELASKRIARLQRPELQRWADGLMTPDRSPSTIRNIVAALRALVAFAELRG